MAGKTILEAEIKSNTGEVTKDVDKLNKATKSAGSSVQKLSVGFGSLAKATGIVALLNKAFEVMQEVFGKNQKVVDAFNTGMTALSIAFNDLFSFLESNIGSITGFFNDLFTNPVEKIKEMKDAIVDGLIKRFHEFVDVLGLAARALGELVTGKFKKAFETIKEAGKEVVDVYTGVDGSYEKVAKTITDYTKKTLEQAAAITETNKAAEKAAVEFAKLNAQYLKDAEIQRQIRDDETKTFEERIAANLELDKILAKQQAAQKEQIQLQIDAAQAQFDINDSNENFIALEEQKVALLELEETITGQLSEQKTNQVALEKELLETQNEIRAEGLTGIERELEELEASYKLKLDMARKSGMDTAAITKQYEQQKDAIVQSSVNTQLGAYSALTGALIKLAGENKELAIAQAIMDTYAAANSILKDPSYIGTARFAAAAAAIITGLANVKSIMETQIPGGGGGGGAVPSGGGQTPAPQMMSGTFELGQGMKPEPVQAFVVSDDITNNQNKLATIRRRATI
tara:strand:+ start:73 stop:1620 length:1548 start_codon:yes stop_codon:yes gene_type:complete